MLKGDCLRSVRPLPLEDARRLVDRFVTHYNQARLHGVFGYVTPSDRPAGTVKIHLGIVTVGPPEFDLELEVKANEEA